MSWRPNEDNDSESEDDEIEYFQKGDREAIIFLIDAFLSENEESFEKCLEIIRKALLNGLLATEKHLIGIVFYNTEHKPDPKDVDGIKNIVIKENTAVLLPLKPLTKDIVAYYLNFSAPNSDHFDFKNVYGCTVGSFANAIWLCTNMFKQSGSKFLSQRIVLFTDKDIPQDVEAGDFQKAIKKAHDLFEVEVDFTIVPMKDDFDYNKFYKEFICTVDDIELSDFYTPDPEEERKCISNWQLRQNFKKKCNARLKWSLGDDLKISVAIYNYCRKNVQPKSVKLLREDNSVVDVKRVAKIVPINDEGSMENARICRPGDERKVIYAGGEKISFTSDELAKMRSPLSPCLILLGFKSRNIISIHNFIRSASFLYPDETVIEGSTKLFRALWEKCIEKEKVAFCVLVPKRKSHPRYVALVPTSFEGGNERSSGLVEKDGFKVVYLPFEIDYRDVDLSEWNALPSKNVTESEVELFEKIIKKLKYKFSPTQIFDPSLEKLQKDIIGLALDVEIEGNRNSGKIDVEKQNSRIEPILGKLKATFGEDVEKSKRKIDTSEQDNRQSKVSKISGDVTEEQIFELIKANNLNQLTAKQLKSYLQSKDVKGISSATKQSLIEKILQLHL